MKPACEHWILIRKPLAEKTVAANVLKHGTGGLNIDECRIEYDGPVKHTKRMADSDTYQSPNGWVETKRTANRPATPTANGRFPANIVLSHNEDCADVCTNNCPVGTLDGQSNKSPSEIGGASRFFYTAKASRSDRGEGNNHPTVKATKLMEYLIKLITPEGGTVLDPFMGSGSTGVSAVRLGFNFIGIEKDEKYFEMAKARLEVA